MAKLSVCLFVERNGDVQNFHDFSQEDKTVLSSRLSDSVSAYYTQNINEIPVQKFKK